MAIFQKYDATYFNHDLRKIHVKMQAIDAAVVADFVHRSYGPYMHIGSKIIVTDTTTKDIVTFGFDENRKLVKRKK